MNHSLFAKLYPNLRFSNISPNVQTQNSVIQAPVSIPQVLPIKQNVISSTNTHKKPDIINNVNVNRQESPQKIEPPPPPVKVDPVEPSPIKISELDEPPVVRQSPRESLRTADEPAVKRQPKQAGSKRPNRKPAVDFKPDLGKESVIPGKGSAKLQKLYSDKLQRDKILDQINRKSVRLAEKDIASITATLDENDNTITKMKETEKELKGKLRLINRAKYFCADFVSAETKCPLSPPKFLMPANGTIGDPKEDDESSCATETICVNDIVESE